MSFNRHHLLQPVSRLLIVGLFFYVISIPSVSAQLEIDFTVGSAEAYPGETGVVIPIYMENTSDSVAGFSFWLQLSNPGVAHFQIGFDSAGTLCSGWQLIEARSLSGTSYDLKILGMANLLATPFNLKIPPQDGSIPLINVLLDIELVPDTSVHRITDILPNTMLDHFGFSDPQGQSIGVIVDSILDTNYFVCNTWAGEVCLDSTQVSGPPFDWIVTEWKPFPYLDTAAVHVTPGTLSVLPQFICGDFTVDGEVNISDLTTFVDYMFVGGPLPQFWQAMDCDGSGQLDVVDLTWFVEFLFTSGSEPLCFPPE